MPHQIASDASFYALVHHLFRPKGDGLPPGSGHEESTRVGGFNSLQFVAPYSNGTLPGEEEFRPVPCRDITPHGLSYLTTEPTAGDYVIVALGTGALVFLSARMVSQRPFVLNGETLSLVTVEFVARVRNAGYGPLNNLPLPFATRSLTHFRTDD
jgi:hypothetical protein